MKLDRDSVGQFVARHWLSLVTLQAAILIGLGYVVGGGLSGTDGGDREVPATQAESTSMWTCSMHPQIQKPGPGLCPICAMDLIPVAAQDGIKTNLRQLTMSREARQLMDIQTTPVQRRFVTADVRMVGKVDYDETRLKHITARVPGRLDRLFVDFSGVQVKEGDHLVYMYSEQLYTAQQELIGAIKSAKVERPDSFFSGGIDLVESSREKLRLLGITDEQVAAIEKQAKPSDHMTVYSPIGGIVIEKFKQEGDRVNVGDRIYTVADLSTIWVMLDAYESDLPWLRYGQMVSFSTEAFPGERFDGQIAFIDPVLNDKTRTVRVRVNMPNAAGKLKPDMFVRAVVKSRVAAGGRVMDAALAGKWISPMHPEIIKDGPGACDKCGMQLVRAETLGYVTAGANPETKPLVIPTSAALVTGTRAIVYVQLADMPPALEDRFNGIMGALSHENVEHVRMAFGEFADYVAQPNSRLKTDFARRHWDYFSKRLAATARTGRTIQSLGFAGELIEELTARMNEMRDYFARPDQPTFHGREIVLGARAGQFYLVKNGLDEGELVVTNGSFKIDSSLQIQASPSMMTPEGGGGGGHDHGGGSPESSGSDGQHSAHAGMQIPVKFKDALLGLKAAVKQLDDAMRTDDLEQIKTAHVGVATAFSTVPSDVLDGHAAMVWKELRMLISNDIFEGGELKQLGDAPRIYASLARNIQRLNEQFGLSNGSQIQRYDTPPAFQLQLAGVWKAYVGLQQALAGDDVPKGQMAVAQMEAALGETDMKLLGNSQAHIGWMKELGNLRKIIAQLKAAKDIAAMRVAFQPLSGEMFVLTRSFGFGPETTVYQLHCSMAFSNKGANWLQDEKQVKNPYFGATMLGCADQVELIAGPQLKAATGAGGSQEDEQK